MGNNMMMNEVLAFAMGIFFGLSIGAGYIYVNEIKPCEKNLPRDQHCKIIGVVDNDSNNN